jgi:ATPase family associated with various cellular activities (AAA)
MNEPAWRDEVRLRAQRRVLWCRELWGRNRYSGEEALAITHSEVERALRPRDELLAEEQKFHKSDTLAAELTAKIEKARRRNDKRWQHLLDLFRLSDGEAALLACALAVESEPSLRRVLGYLEDQVSPIDVSPAIVADLWAMPEPPIIGSGSPLRRWRLAEPLATGREPESNMGGWTADPQLLTYLLSESEPDQESPESTAACLYEQDRDAISALIGAFTGGGPSLQVEINAPRGAGKATLAAQACGRLGYALVAVDCAGLAAATDPRGAAIRALRTATLNNSLVHWRRAELLEPAVLTEISQMADVTFIGTDTPLRSHPGSGTMRRTFRLRALTRSQRIDLWSALSKEPVPVPVRDWALGPGEVVAAKRAATIGEDAVREICKGLLLDVPSELITPLRQPYVWDDLIVPAQLHEHLQEFEGQSRARAEVLDDWGLGRLSPLGRGVTAMFAGPSGTGKTMAAQVLARELGLELLRIDLAGVVNKYIGETEKHLRSVFAACERAPVMLFFDEADALFGRRMQVNDAHDRFANIEVDYLLQRMEEFDGVAVLATNRKGDIDTAFMRRLRFVIDFAPPTVAERERIWRAALEASREGDGTPLTESLDWQALARDLDLTGAGIKSTALGAAFLARSEGSRIATRHIFAAARRELEKQGVVVRAGRLENAKDDGHNGNGAGKPLSAGEIEQMVNGALR